VRLPRFEYLEPETLLEACNLLSQHKGKAKVIAGGTDLLVKMKKGEIAPKYLIGLDSIPNLDYITHDEASGLKIGILTTLGTLQMSPLIQSRYNVLAQAIHKLAFPQIRSLATLAGNLCNAAPSADSAPALIVIGARLKLASATGERTISVEEFFTGPYKTVLGSGELLAEIQILNPPCHSAGIYLKHSLRHTHDLPTANVAVMITLEPNKDICKDIRIALGTVTPTPMRATEAEDILRGKPFKDKLIEQVAQMAAGESRPRNSLVRGPAEYRREVTKVLTRRAVIQALNKAQYN
jgi:carbon-monoxide dehydrogenase medium subunit